MATQWQTFPVEFKGGLISNLSPLQQGINAVGSATTLQNFEPSKEGGYKKVLGYSRYIDDVVPGSGSVLAVRVVNQEKALAIRKNGSNFSEYYINVAGAWSSLGAAASLGGKVRGVDFNFGTVHKVMLVDGVNSPAVFEDTTDTLTFPTLTADATGAEHIEIYKNTIFLGNGSNLVFSAPYDETDFTPANGGGIINVGHTITGLIVFRDQLIIFSRNTVQRLTGSSIADFQLQPISDGIGCLFPDTIQEVGGDVIYMAADGLRLLSATDRIGDFGLEIASAPISKDALDFIKSTDNFSSIVLREKAQYRVFGHIESVADQVSKGLVATKFSDQGASRIEWGTLEGFKVYCSDGRYIPGQELTLFANGTGYVYKLEDGSSRDGETIRAVYESPFMPIDDPKLRKTLYKATLYVDLNGTFSVDFNLKFDLFKVKNYNSTVQPATINLASSSTGVFVYGGVNSLYGTATYGSQLDKVYDTPVIGSGQTFAFRIEDISINPSFTLDTAIFEYRSHDRN